MRTNEYELLLIKRQVSTYCRMIIEQKINQSVKVGKEENHIKITDCFIKNLNNH